MAGIFEQEYSLLSQTPRQFLERRLATLFGINSMAIRALDLVCEEMSKEKGFIRDDGQDYFNHCIEVATTLLSFCIKDEDAICAGLLHDLVEDVEGYTKEVIAKLFNENVAYLVMIVTKDPNIDYDIPENLIAYLEEIAKNIFTACIKTADRMHNMMTMEKKTFEATYRKALETDKYYLPFFKYCRVTYPRYENLFFAARSQIYPLSHQIKRSFKEITRLSVICDERDKEIIELKQKILELEKSNITLKANNSRLKAKNDKKNT